MKAQLIRSLTAAAALVAFLEASGAPMKWS